MKTISVISDRMTKGIIAGAAGAVVQNVYAYLAFLAGLTRTLYIDVARSVVFDNNNPGVLTGFLGLTAHIIIDSLWGILFAFLIKATSSRNYLLKGIVFGGGIWFVIRVTGTKILEIPEFTQTSPVAAMVFLLGGFLYGFTIALILRQLDIANEIGG